MKLIPKQPRKKKITRGTYGEGSVYKNGRLFWFKIPTPTGPHIGSCKTDNIDEARRVLERERAAIKNKLNPDAKPEELQRVTKIHELLDLYYAELRKIPGSDWANAEKRLDKHIRPWFGNNLASDLSPHALKRYRAAKTTGEKPISDTSVNRHFAMLRRAFVIGQEHGLISTIPKFPLTDESKNRRTGILSATDYPRLLAALPECLRPLLIAGYILGIRSGELRKYTWDMVNWADSPPTIRVPGKLVKNREDRYVPIIGDLLPALKAQKELRDREFPSCPWIFFWRGEDAKGHRVVPGTNIKNFSTTWNNAVASIGQPDMIFHDLRRTAITNMIEEYGLTPEEACYISGHKTTAMIKRYQIGTKKSVMRVGKLLEEKMAGAGREN